MLTFSVFSGRARPQTPWGLSSSAHIFFWGGVAKEVWREPKLFIIHVVDPEGKLERSFMPVMDANIRGPDALFKLLRTYLGQLGIAEAGRVLFVAHGARWIGNRIPALVPG
jgi:hypothetical protein